MEKKTSAIALTTLLLPVMGIILWALWLPQHLDFLTAFAARHKILAPFLVILWRFISIVIPPIPGGIVSLALLPVFGWFWSFVYASVGILLGTSVAFWLGRTFREPLVRKFVPLKQMHKWESQFSGKTKFFAFLGLRFATAPVFDFVSYVAGLSKLSFLTFFIVNLIALAPDVLLFRVGEELYKESVYAGILGMAGFALLFYLYKKASTEG